MGFWGSQTVVELISNAVPCPGCVALRDVPGAFPCAGSSPRAGATDAFLEGGRPMRKRASPSDRQTVKLSFEVPRSVHAKLVWLAASRGVLSSELASGFIVAGLRASGVSCSERGPEIETPTS